MNPEPQTGEYSALLEITPEMANNWWKTKRRVKNRPIKKGRVLQYKSDMAAGRFYPNNDSICFDAEGYLINGHHRLQACIKAGTPFKSFVHYNLDPRAFVTMDVPAARSMADVLDLSMIPNARIIGPALLLWARFQAGKLDGGSMNLTFQDQEDVYRANKDAVDAAAALIAELKWSYILPPAVALFFLLVFRLEDPARADEFMRSLSTGAHLSEGHPIIALRDALINSRRSNLKSATLTQHMIIALTLKAWQLVIKGKQSKHLRLTAAEAKRLLKSALTQRSSESAPN